VHLPAGQVDVTLRTAGPADDPVPPLSISISGPDGTAPPEVIVSPRAKYSTAQYDMLVRVWVVQVVQEGDYHIGRGRGLRPLPAITELRRTMWNEPLEALHVLRCRYELGPCLSAVIGFVGLVLTLSAQCTNRRPYGAPLGRESMDCARKFVATDSPYSLRTYLGPT
jgi:hypothetical protein